MAAKLTNRTTVRVEWGDCDPGGIVYFPRYLEYCDACTNQLFEKAGLPKPQMMKTYRIAGIPLVEARARFIVPSQFGDSVKVASQVVEWGRTSFSVRHQIWKAKVLAAEIFEKRVWVSRADGGSGAIRYKGVMIPDEVKVRFEKAGSKRSTGKRRRESAGRRR
jgi:4-hydroxybenzoyl-CoA thioesterase